MILLSIFDLDIMLLRYDFTKKIFSEFKRTITKIEVFNKECPHTDEIEKSMSVMDFLGLKERRKLR